MKLSIALAFVFIAVIYLTSLLQPDTKQHVNAPSPSSVNPQIIVQRKPTPRLSELIADAD